MASQSSITVSSVAPIAATKLDVLALHVGQVINAEVVSLQSAGEALIALKGQAIQTLLSATLDTGVAIQPGQTVTLKVLGGQTVGADGQVTLPRLQVLSKEEAIAAKAGAALDTNAASVTSAPLGKATVTGAAVDTDAGLSRPTAPATAAPPQTVAQIVQTEIGQAAGVQNSLAPLFANLAALQQRPLPEGLRRVVDQLLDLRLSPEDPELPQALERAVRASGLFLESHLAGAEPHAALDPDIKSLLLALKEQLEKLPTSPQPPPNDLRSRPPLRGETPIGQAASQPSLDPQAPLDRIAAVLKPETDAAIARIQLSQYASINSPETGPTASRDAPQWTFELPIALTPQQTAMAQFQLVHERVDEDGSGVTSVQERSWKVRFSVDTAEDGKVFAQINLRAGLISVFLSAERPETVQRFQSDLPELVGALQAATLELDAVQCLAATPRPATSPAGSLVNVST